MKQIDGRDQININKTQDLMRRYDFSILDRLGETEGTQQESAQISFTGISFEWNSNTIPSGYLEEMGQTLNIATYPELYAILGTMFGGDGTTTFMLPDSRTRVSVGYSSGDSNFGTLGGKGGHISLQSHTHSGSSNSNGNHSHTFSVWYSSSSGSGDSVEGWRTRQIQDSHATNSTGSHSHTINIGSTGSGNAQNLQPYIVKRKIIKY